MDSKSYVKKIFTEGKILNDCLLTTNNGVITQIEENVKLNKPYDAEIIAPALVDLHINGGEKHHFTHEPTLETLHDIVNSAQKNGVGYLQPTLITSSIENIFKGIASTKTYMQKHPRSGVLGMHLEGPFLNKKKRGAHLEKYILKPDIGVLKEILTEGKNVITFITVAPENFTEKELEYLINSGITVSAGHSNATFEEAQRAFEMGIKNVTHLFNAMSAFTHRSPGLVGASLLNQNVYTPIILDNVHIDDNTAKIAFKNKKDKLYLISDALFQNYKKEHFKWEEFDAKLQGNGYFNSEGNLAGAAFSLLDAVKNAIKVLDISQEKALSMATDIPASLINTNRKFGKIAVGYEAKLISGDAKLNNIIFSNN